MEESNLKNNNNQAALNPFASNSQYKTGVANVDNMTAQGNEILNNSVNAQTQAIDQGTQTNISELQRQSEKAEAETLKNNKGLYQEYQKQINPFGVGQESLAGQGLAHSGIAESTRTSIYNNYQRNITESMNNLRNVKADYNAKMAEVRSSGDIAKAEALSNAYLQQLSMIQNAYSLAQGEKEFEWQKSTDERNFNYQQNRDAVTDKQWQDQFNYQKERDKVADNQWQQQLNLSKSKSSGGSSGRSKSSSGTTGGLLVTDGNPYSNDKISIEQLVKSTMNLAKKVGNAVIN